jgi:CRISPR/Cas system-associated protein Cas10 (large subunit of type III CRISPR-Cas system)
MLLQSAQTHTQTNDQAKVKLERRTKEAQCNAINQSSLSWKKSRILIFAVSLKKLVRFPQILKQLNKMKMKDRH